MLDHDDLLSEEQAYPHLIQKLQASYQMKPEEIQILTRVQERLAHNSDPLPILTPTQKKALKPITTLSSPSQRIKSTQSRLPHLNIFAAALVIGLLVGSLFITLSLTKQSNIASFTSRNNSMRILLLPVGNSPLPSKAEMEDTRTILATRFKQFGFRGSDTIIIQSNNRFAILLELPHVAGNEQLIIHTLLEPGKLEFWDTGPHGLLIQGTTFNPGNYTQYNHDAQPHFTNHDLNPKAFSVVQDLTTKQYDIKFAMQGDALNRFQLYTGNAIGHVLTVTLDNIVLNSAIIQSAIPGIGALSDNFTLQQANALIPILKSPVLPVELKQVS